MSSFDDFGMLAMILFILLIPLMILRNCCANAYLVMLFLLVLFTFTGMIWASRRIWLKHSEKIAGWIGIFAVVFICVMMLLRIIGVV